MEEYLLAAEKREILGKKVKALRREGKLPAVIYGSGIEPQPITLDRKLVRQTLKVIGANTLVTVQIGKEKHLALVRDIQREVIMQDLLHIDFQAVSLEEKITTTVPIAVEGDAPAVKEYNAVLTPGLTELQIEAKAKDLPDAIAADVSTLLEIGDHILVKNLKVPAEVTVLDDPDEIVYVAAAQTLMEIEEEVVEEGELFEELTDAELMEEMAEAGEEEGSDEE